jgi:glycerophosphoryl diester phosphodiesterase
MTQRIGTSTEPVIIECDIDLTKDSVMVMMHDATLDRTTTGTGKLIEKTYAELAPIRLEDNLGNVTPYKIPTLENVLRWGKNKATFTLDVKRNVSFEKVVDLVHKTGASNYVAVITYNAQDAAKLHKLDPGLMISVTIRNRAEYDRLHELGIPDNRMVAFVGVKEPGPELYTFLHQKGIACILGTLGNLDKQAAAKGDQVYKKFADNGADVMSTDRPLEVWEAIK